MADEPLISVHALRFPYYNVLHMTRSRHQRHLRALPRLKTMWIEGAASPGAVPDAAARQQYMMRPSEAPLLKRLPSEYMAEQYYATQPLELTKNRKLLEATFDAIKAETQLCFSTDYPHGISTCRRQSTRPAVPLRGGQTQHPRRQCAEAVRAEALAIRQERQAGTRAEAGPRHRSLAKALVCTRQSPVGYADRSALCAVHTRWCTLRREDFGDASRRCATQRMCAGAQ
jgi:hypothetical protein